MMYLYLDLKVVYKDDDHEGVTVSTSIYDQACVTDPKKGIEVSGFNR